MTNLPSPEERAGLGAAGVAAGLGCSIAVSVVISIGGGVVMDRWLDTSPIFTLIGVAIGLLAAGYQLYELAQYEHRGHRPGPVTRAIARIPARQPQDSRPPNSLDGQARHQGHEE